MKIMVINENKENAQNTDVIEINSFTELVAFWFDSNDVDEVSKSVAESLIAAKEKIDKSFAKLANELRKISEDHDENKPSDESKAEDKNKLSNENKTTGSKLVEDFHPVDDSDEVHTYDSSNIHIAFANGYDEGYIDGYDDAADEDYGEPDDVLESEEDCTCGYSNTYNSCTIYNGPIIIADKESLDDILNKYFSEE